MASKQQVSEREREKMIAEGAYYLALQRGFEGGDPVRDWLQAEEAIDGEFNLQPHDNVLGQLYEQLSAVNEKVLEMTERLKAEAREELQEDLLRIHELRDDFSDKLDEIRELAGEARQAAKREAEKLRDDLVAALKQIGAPRDEAE